MKRGAILAAAALAVTSFVMTASPACAQDPGMAPMSRHGFDDGHGFGGPGHLLPPGPWWRNPATVSAIGLSPDQQKKIDEIFLNQRVQLIHMHASLEENQLRLDDVLNGTSFDAAKAQKLIDEGADLRASLEKADAHMLLTIRGVLTADQWTKLQTARHMAPRPDRGGEHGMDRGPRPKDRHFDGPGHPPMPPPASGGAPAPPASE